MQQSDGNCTSRKNWVDLAGTSCTVFETKPLTSFKIIKARHSATFTKVHLEVYFWGQSDVSSPRNIYWTDTARVGGGLDMNDLVFRQHWRKNLD